MKKSIKPTLSIALPAYNEQGNISMLLNDILLQKSSSFIIEKIIINSDGSTDKTVEVARKVANKKILVIDNKDNQGVAIRQNEILQMCTSDILVLLNGDIRIHDPQFISRLTQPITADQAELTSPRLSEHTARTFFESVLAVGAKLRHTLFMSWRNGQNGFLCHGAVRAMSRKFYSKLYFQEGGGEDMYTYLRCLSLNFRFRYIDNAVAMYRLPKSFRDHFKQSARFFKYQNQLAREFKGEFIDSELRIPLSAYFRGAISAVPIILYYPVHVVAYVITVMIIKTKSYFLIESQNLWNVTSTKA